MANVKISQLPAASTVTADVDVLPIVHSGVTEKVTPNQIVNKVLEAPGEIGGTTPNDATFTTLIAESSVFLNPANADVELSPTGSGRTLILPEAGAIINPGVLSYMDNVAIGGTTPQAAVFTTLTSNSTTTLNGTTIPASKTLVDTDSVQTLSSKYYLNPRIWDWDQNNYYRISPVSPGLATDVYCYLPILTGNDYFSFRNFAETLTNKTISGLSNTLTDIPNSSFQYSSITLGSTSISLGGTASSITGLALTGGTVNNTAIGGTTASSGAFTTLSASSTVSGTGFSTYLASPPAIGGTTPAAGSFTILSSTGNTTLGDASGDTLTINAGTTTFAQGTANGVLYLNGSKAATSGSGLVFDGTNLGVGVASPLGTIHVESAAASGVRGLFKNTNSSNGESLVCFADKDSSTNFQVRVGSTGNNLVLYAGNAERARLTSKGLLVDYTSDSGLSGTGNAIFSGNVGIGTSSPGAKLHVETTGSTPQLRLISSGNALLRSRYIDATYGFAIESNNSAESAYAPLALTGSTFRINTGSGANAAIIDSSGNLGLGVTPSHKLDVVADSGAIGLNIRGRSSDGISVIRMANNSDVEKFRLDVRPDNTVFFSQGGTTTAMTLDTSGRLIVSETSANGNGNVYLGNKTVAGVKISALCPAGAENTTVNSTTYTLTFNSSCKVFWLQFANGDGVLCVANYNSSTITILGPTGTVVNSSSPGALEFGVSKSAGSHVITFKTGSNASAAYGSWGIQSLSSSIN